MPDSSDTKISSKMLRFLVAVMFLFGGTAGYIVRDVRADEQVLHAVDGARASAEAIATEALQRTQAAAGIVTSGMRVAAESTSAAVQALAGGTDDGDSAAAGPPPPKPSLSAKTGAAASPTKSKPARR